MFLDAAASNDTAIASEYSYIQTFINFLKQIVEIIVGLFTKIKEGE